jgi:hypothetical protein
MPQPVVCDIAKNAFEVATDACDDATGRLRYRKEGFRCRNGVLSTSQPVVCDIAKKAFDAATGCFRCRNQVLAISQRMLSKSQRGACDVATRCLRYRNQVLATSQRMFPVFPLRKSTLFDFIVSRRPGEHIRDRLDRVHARGVSAPPGATPRSSSSRLRPSGPIGPRNERPVPGIYSPASAWYFPRSFPALPRAQVAQLVEQRTENPRVGGSIPSLGTTSNHLEVSDLASRVRRPMDQTSWDAAQNKIREWTKAGKIAGGMTKLATDRGGRKALPGRG